MIRISSHANDQGVIILKVDQLHNTVIGSFQPARRQDDMGVGVYVMEIDKLDSLKSWARYQNIHLLDEVRSKAEPTKPLQCGNVLKTWVAEGREVREYCCAPYHVTSIPKFCGACGQPANPVTYDADGPDIGAKCTACARVNHGGPAYCLGCGTPLPEHHLSAPALARVKAEPVPLGAAIAELNHQGES